jgi:hypothetical protein
MAMGSSVIERTSIESEATVGELPIDRRRLKFAELGHG